MWSSYPVFSLFILLIILTAIITILEKKLRGYLTENIKKIFIKRRYLILGGIGLFFVWLFGIFGQFSKYPLRWSDAYISKNRKVNDLATNPLVYFAYTLGEKPIKFNKKELAESIKIVAKSLNSKSGEITRLQTAKKGQKKPNIIMVLLESMGANRMGILGHKLNLTPNLDSLAKEGYFFENFFVPSVSTAKSVYSSLFGLADTSLTSTISRNPLAVNQHSIVNQFKDYKKYFFIGGSASWANIRGILKSNIKGINLFEGEKENTWSIADVWGLSDLKLFRQSNKELNKAPQPFFAYIQTAGNHPPFVIPKKDNANFIRKNFEKELYSQYGNVSEDRIEAIRFFDHCIGEFIKMFKKSKYYGNTIIAFFGDHNSYSTQAKHMRPLEHLLSLDSIHVPLIIYAPEIIKTPKRIKPVTSLLDILPSLAYISGIDIVNKTLGKNIFDPYFQKNNFVFSFLGNTPNILKENFYYTKNSLFNLNSKELIDEKGTYPQKYLEMKKLAYAFLRVNQYLIFNVK